MTTTPPAGPPESTGPPERRAPLIEVRGLTYRYPGAQVDALSGLDIAVAAGEFLAVVGANGSGKSTLAKLLGGLEKPAGALAATVCGLDLLSDAGRLAARRDVGVLFQNPENQLVAECVEDDIAFGLENLAWPPDAMRARVDAMLARFDLADLGRRQPHQLSGGQKQRTALAGVLAVPRRALVLDEPTAMLDPAGRTEVLAAVRGLREEGLAVIYVTQEMDEVVDADRVVALEAGAVVFDGAVDELFADGALVRRLGLGLPAAGELALALVAVGRELRPLPLSTAALAGALHEDGWADARSAGERRNGTEDRAVGERRHEAEEGPSRSAPTDSSPAGMALECRRLSFSYAESQRRIPALDDVSFSLASGRSLALLGASGSGKSTLLQVIKGLDPPEAGEVLLDGSPAGAAGHVEVQREVGLVFQTPELQLFAASAREDVAFGPRRLGWSDDEVTAAVNEALTLVDLSPERFADRHPYALSGGEQRRLALAGVLAMRPRLLLLDEPFVSLDPATRRELVSILRRLRDGGVTLVLATHDVDLAWALCDELLVLDEGRVVAAGRWDFSESGRALLAACRLREPFLVELWRRLGRDPDAAPRTVAAAAEALR